MRSLTNERGPWSPYFEGERPKVYWKVDEVENRCRMRQKLKINHEGTDHKDAADARQYGRKHTRRKSVDIDFIKLSRQLGPLELKQDSKRQKEGKEDEWEPVAEEEAPEQEQKEVKKATSERERPVFNVKCTQVTPGQTIHGILTLTTVNLFFEVRDPAEAGPEGINVNNLEIPVPSDFKDRKWPLADVCAIHFRRYLMRRSSIEVFFEDRLNYFLVFENETVRNDVYRRILRTWRPFRAAAKAARASYRRLGYPSKHNFYENLDYTWTVLDQV